MFQNQAALQVEQLKEYAVRLGLDAERFNACLDGGEKAPLVREDLADAEDYGVAATPTFFINGRTLSGAQPFEAFQRIIDDELTRAR